MSVSCCPPYYPAWKLETAYAWPPYRRERWQGVDVWRAPLWVPRTPSVSRGSALVDVRAVVAASDALAVLWRPDVVMTVAPFFLCAPAGWLTARLSGARAWLHMQDFEVDVAFQMGCSRKGLAESGAGH